MRKASQGPLKGAVSAQKALQESETRTKEMLGGREENSLPSRQIYDFYKKQPEKN